MRKYLYDKYENKPTIHSLTPYWQEYLENLVTKYNLNKLCTDCKSEYEKVLCVSKWVSNLWEHDGTNQPEKFDVDFILNEVINNGKRFRCVEYGNVIHGCLTALNITSRELGLMTEDVETRDSNAGHVGTEVYLKDINKWIFVDGQWGMIPILDNKPLNAVEFAESLENIGEYGERLSVEKLNSTYSIADYFAWIKEYLYFYNYTYWENDNSGNRVNKNIMLGPIGIEAPKAFQIKYPIMLDIYTHSVLDFYLPVDIH